MSRQDRPSLPGSIPNQAYEEEHDAFDDYDDGYTREGCAAVDSDVLANEEKTTFALKTSTDLTVVQLQEFLAIRKHRQTSCRTIPLTVSLWIVYLMVVFQHGGVQTSYESSSFIRESIRGSNFRDPSRPSGPNLRLHDVVRWQQIFPWIDQALVPMLQKSDRQQVLLGFARVRQTRGMNKTCEFTSDGFESFYQAACHPPGGIVGTYGRKRPKYETQEPAFVPVESGNVYEMWLEVNRTREVVSNRIKDLHQEGWIDMSTQSVFIEGLFLNVEINVYSHFTVMFTMHREGLAEPEVKVHPLRAEVFNHWAQILLDVIWFSLFCALVYTMATETVQEVRKGVAWLHMTDPYFWLEVSLVALGVAIFLTFYVFVYWLGKFSEQVHSLGIMPPLSVAESSDDRKVQAKIEAMAYQDQLTVIIDWFHWFVNMTKWYRFCSVLYACLMVFRFFRGFQGQPRIQVLVQVFLSSAAFLLHFFLLLTAVFASFALSGYILFGEQVDSWTTPGRAISRMLLVFFMRFDYNEFHSVAPVSASIWFTCFFVLVVVLLQRLLAAAVVYQYMFIRSSWGEAGQSLASQIMTATREMFWARTYKGSLKSVPLDELLAMITADADPDHIRRLGAGQVDRQMRTRAELHQAESSPAADLEFLVKRGCEPQAAKRLLLACADWSHSINVTSNPVRRLLISLIRQVNHLRFETEKLHERVHDKFADTVRTIDRIDLKQAKCLSLARRVRKAQQLPPGWTAHTDAAGRRYLRQEETSLTSWTLPKHLL